VKDHTIYAYIYTCSKRKHTKDVGDSDLIPFEERPFGITPADDQYIYEDQALNWSEGTITFGEETFDEPAFDEHMFDKHV